MTLNMGASIVPISYAKNPTNTHDSFKEIAERVSAIFNRCGVEVIPYKTAELPLFSALSAEQKQNIVAQIGMYLSTIEYTINQSVDLNNNAQALWAAIKYWEYRHSSDFFKYITDADEIEVYDNNGIQIWRNINIMRNCSYSLEELYCMTWQERYDREDTKTRKIMEIVTKVLTTGEPNFDGIKNHVFREICSSKMFVLEACHEAFLPLFGTSKKPEAFVVTSKVRVLDSGVSPSAPLNSLPL